MLQLQIIYKFKTKQTNITHAGGGGATKTPGPLRGFARRGPGSATTGPEETTGPGA